MESPVRRELIVMRHAKSSWKQPTLADHDRPLNNRGKRDAPRVAAYLETLDWLPDSIVSSDAERTRQTLELMCNRWSYRPPITWTRALYLAGWSEVYGVADRWESNIQRVMIVGHNPGWEALCAKLTGHWQQMTTANVALLTGQGASWRQALLSSWELVQWVRPREIP